MFNVGVEHKRLAEGGIYANSLAIVRIRIGEETLISAAEGNGPVNALDLALRKDLGVYQKHIQDVELIDFRVRVFQGGTDAVTRVLVEFGAPDGSRWSTVGVSGNIIEASFQALVDAINYRLVKAGA
jgi:2-isopropylmalate synthase